MSGRANDVDDVRTVVEQALNDAGYPTRQGANGRIIVYDKDDDAALARLSVDPI